MRLLNQREIKHLRRLALKAQGLLKSNPFGRGMAGTRQTIRHIGYIQLDTISVVERAHHHVLYSRVPGFNPKMTNQLLLRGEIFEYWSHAAAFLPIEDFRFSLPYKNAIKSGQTHWFKDPDQKLMAELLARIKSDGPLCSRDVEQDQPKRAGWWDWKPAKKALEQLYMQGDLMVSNRAGFQKTYDLTERVLPDQVDTRVPSVVELASHLLEQQLRCHKVVTLKGLTYLRRNAALRKAMKGLIDDQLAADQLEAVQLPTGEVCFVHVGVLDQPMPRTTNRCSILSPFDNSVIQRDRLKAVFGFDYQIECYVPATKRKYGYFSLPLLYRDCFFGRMDCKAHRQEQHLEIKSLFLEPHRFDQDQLLVAFSQAVKNFCQFQQCKNVSLTHVEPKTLKSVLQNALV